MPQVLLGVGSNLGDRESILTAAADALGRKLQIQAVSNWFTYPAVGGPDGQQDFLNGAIVADTELTADEVRELLQDVERDAGRERVVRWSSRTLDCDLLLYGTEVIDTPELQVPHPRMITRRFVLEPANEVACDMIHPRIGWSIGELYQHLQTAPPYFCVLGSSAEAVRTLTHQLCEATHCVAIEQLAPFSGSTYDSALEWFQRANALLPDELVATTLHRQQQDSKTHGDERYGDDLDGDGLSDHQLKLDRLPGFVSGFWCWEPWLHNPKLKRPTVHPLVEPKLIIVIDSARSVFGQRFSQLAPPFRVPTLFLSDDPSHASQDAIGAVQAMTM